MPTIDNPYASPFAQPLSKLATAFMSGPTEAQNIYTAERALRARQEREGIDALSSQALQLGNPGYDVRNSIAAAFRGGVNPVQVGAGGRVYSAVTHGAADPRTDNWARAAGDSFGSTADAFRQTQSGIDRRHGQSLDENRRQFGVSQEGIDRRHGQTLEQGDRHFGVREQGVNQRHGQTLEQGDRQFNVTHAERQRQFDAAPQVIDTPQGPVIARRADSYGQPAVEDLGKVKGSVARNAINQPGGIASLNPTEQRFVGADPRTPGTPRMYMAPDSTRYVTNDGVTDARSGQPLPPGGSLFSVQGTPDQAGLRPTVQGKLQEANIANQRFKALLGFTRQIAEQDATNFGVTGSAKGAVQDIGQMAGNIAQGLGYTGVQEALDSVRQRAAASGVNPGVLSGLFDPNLPALHTAADLLIYSAAESLAGQSGRSVSDRDVILMRNIVGDPREWLSSQEKFLAKLTTIEQVLSLQQGVVDQNLRGTGTAAPAQAAPGATVPPPPAPGAPQPAPEDQKVIGGKTYFKINGQWFEQ